MQNSDIIKIVCISDTHNYDFGYEIPEGDILIHAGDFSRKGYEKEIDHFIEFL